MNNTYTTIHIGKVVFAEPNLNGCGGAANFSRYNLAAGFGRSCKTDILVILCWQWEIDTKTLWLIIKTVKLKLGFFKKISLRERS